MADDITPGELSRRLEGLTAELVRRDVYEAHRQADAERDRRVQADIDRLDREADAREAGRQRNREEVQRMVRTAVLGSVGAALASIISGVIVAVVLR